MINRIRQRLELFLLSVQEKERNKKNIAKDKKKGKKEENRKKK